MLAELQARLEPYLSILGAEPWLQAVVALVGSLAIAWIFNHVICNALRRMAARTQFRFDDYLIEHLHRPIYYTLILVGLALAIELLKFNEVFDEIAFSIWQTIGFVVWSVFIIRAARSLLKAFAESEERVKVVNPQTLPLFNNVVVIAIVVLSVYLIFTAWHVDMTAWLASAGIVGIAVGFAAKDTLANLFSGAFNMADAPYKIGDYVVLETGERGEITHIGIRSTRMMTRDDVEITVPNSVMGNTMIINESGGPHEKYRIRVKVGVAYASDIDRVREVLMAIALNDEDVCQDPEPRVRFRQFGGSSLDFELLCWVEQPVLRGRVLDTLNCKIYKRFAEEDIEIPYSKHDVYIKQMPE